MLNIDVDADGLSQLTRDLNATERHAQAALRSTLVKMAAWLRVRSLRGLSDHLQVQQKILRRRLKSFSLRKSADGQEITVWYGLDDIALIHMGARETKSGVTAGKHKRDGAFIANGRGGSRQAFKRRGAARLPLEKQSLEVNDKAQIFIEGKLLGAVEFDAQFFKTFEHELKWRMQTQK